LKESLNTRYVELHRRRAKAIVSSPAVAQKPRCGQLAMSRGKKKLFPCLDLGLISSMIFLLRKMVDRKKAAPRTREETVSGSPIMLKGERIMIQRKLENDSTLSPGLKTRPFPANKLFRYRKDI